MDLGGAYIQNIADTSLSNVKFDQFKKDANSFNPAGENPKSVEEAAKEFEGLFVGQLLQLMFDTVEVDSLFGGGHAEETYRSLLVDEYGKALGESGGIGISDNVQKTLLQMQGLDGEAIMKGNI